MIDYLVVNGGKQFSFKAGVCLEMFERGGQDTFGKSFKSSFKPRSNVNQTRYVGHNRLSTSSFICLIHSYLIVSYTYAINNM